MQSKIRAVISWKVLIPLIFACLSMSGHAELRFQRLLSDGSSDSFGTFSILFYGQSISKQDWWKAIAAEFNNRYPGLPLSIENKSIGGFDSRYLVKSVEHDVIPLYPDVVLLHAYGSRFEAYEELVSKLSRNLTTDIILATHHFAISSDGSREQKDDLESEIIREIARKYKCGLIDVRLHWDEYLQRNALDREDVLRDRVHLNQQGNQVMASIYKDYLFGNLDMGGESRGSITVKKLDQDSGAIRAKVDGNRVDLLLRRDAIPEQTANEIDVEIFLGGRPLSAVPDLVYLTRASSSPSSSRPAIVGIGAPSQLLPEQWRLSVVELLEAGEFAFELWGSKTGYDGRGRSDEYFLSRSGGIIIEPESWDLRWALKHRKRQLEIGYVVSWEAVGSYEREINERLKRFLADNNENTSDFLRITLFTSRKSISEFLDITGYSGDLFRGAHLIIHDPNALALEL